MVKKKFIAIGMGVAILSSSLIGLANLKEASAATTQVQAVHAKIEHITYSLKNNYLGLKNVGVWQGYIKEARNLNAKLPNGSSKDKYALRIEKADALINAAARVNHVEKSMEINAHIMKNVPQWESYINLANTDMTKVDMSIFKPQVNELERRVAVCGDVINEIKNPNSGGENGSGEEDLKIVYLKTDGEKVANKNYKGDVIISANDMTLKDSVILGDLYVSGSGNTLENIEIKGKLIIDASSQGLLNLNNVNASEVIMNQ